MPSRRLQVASTITKHAASGMLALGTNRNQKFAAQMREAFEELGPAFIKLGQLISVRPDLFGPDLVFEMERLRDSVPALPASEIRIVIAKDLGAQPEELFDEFDEQPVASASIAQVHKARLRADYRPVSGAPLKAGTLLAVKVVRPGVEESILADLAAARGTVEAVARWTSLSRYNPQALLDEFADSLRSECDLRNEAKVADRFAFDFREDRLVLVPRIVWPLTTRRVLTMEYVEGWRLTDIGEAERRGIDGRGLALHGAEMFMRQVLVLGRFHADLHPANLFVTPDGRIAYLDFGIIGVTRPAQRGAIAQVLAATVYGDADRALRYSAELGLVVPESSRERVREQVALLMRRTLAGERKDVRGFAIGFLRIMNAERVEVPVGFGLLVKALVTVEGVARQLYPDIDITEAARPYATSLIARQMMEPSRVWERMPAAIRAGLRELTR